MNKYIKGLMLGTAVIGLTACSDFLNETPPDKLIPENFFNTADNLKSYTINFYGLFPTHSSYMYRLGTFSSDNGTDNQVEMSASVRWVPGEWRTSNDVANWDFSNIRRLNYFFSFALPEYEAGNISGNESEVRQAIGEAYFFLAYSYWSYYSAVGDYPIIDGVLSEDKELLLDASVRQPRNKVARYILEQLDKAIEFLPETSSYGANGLNKDCANLFRSRVALFEGTWLKYFNGTPMVPSDLDCATESKYFLDEAMKSAKVVGDKFVNNLVQNTGTIEGMGEGFTVDNPYYYMFCCVDPSAYSEVLLFKSYDKTAGQVTQIQNQFQQNAGGTGWTRGLVNSFLMKNGLPIYDAASGYDPDWENNGVSASLKDRDSRIVIFTKGDNSIMSLGTDGMTPRYYNISNVLSRQDLTACPTGYAVKKGQDYDFKQANMNLQTTTASIVFRAAEALLNYMEACVEANNGNVDATADSYWRALRKRAKVDEDYTKTIAATQMAKEAEGDWGAYSANKLVSPTLYNVRRERRNELIGEGLRLNDIRRWRALDQMITTPYQIEGMKYWGTVYADPNSDMCFTETDENGDKVFLPAFVSPESGRGNMSPEANSPYVRPFQVSKVDNLVWDGLKFTPAHYLSPIGHDAFVNASVDKNDISTSKIVQNPGWPVEGNVGATMIANWN
ncbi:MAG: RagB/SusD family nutrient uptake outer membrane protein [Paramuribaculum sp.]|nr:RagB/SusD family nutrient uptake outer membrane protein [Paramuribaculum sp.]MDE7452051.1 RagB/SusD family nutrient uptake outer membrane protein [Paramuribaculum sp.]